MTKPTQKPTQTIPIIVLKNTFVASNAPPILYPKGEIGNNTWQTTTDWLCFRYWAGGSGTAHRSFSGGHGAHCSPCFRSGQAPPSRPRPAHKTPLRTPNRTSSSLIRIYGHFRLLQEQTNGLKTEAHNCMRDSMEIMGSSRANWSKVEYLRPYVRT